MEKYIILVNQKTQYCKDAKSSQSDLQMQPTPNENPSRLFSGSKIRSEIQKTQNNQDSCEEEEKMLEDFTLPDCKTTY